MHSKITRYIFAVITGLMLSATILADSPSLLVATCVSCHGSGGSSLGPSMPSIANMNQRRFIQAMQDFKSDKRPSTIMGRIAKGYTEADFKIMANYFAKQKFVRYPQEIDQERVERGRKLHKRFSCKRCHTKGGFSNKKAILAGQWMPYLRFSLADFYTGVRKTEKGKMEKKIKKMVKKKGKESLEDIVHFYGSQIERK